MAVATPPGAFIWLSFLVRTGCIEEVLMDRPWHELDTNAVFGLARHLVFDNDQVVSRKKACTRTRGNAKD